MATSDQKFKKERRGSDCQLCQKDIIIGSRRTNYAHGNSVHFTRQQHTLDYNEKHNTIPNYGNGNSHDYSHNNSNKSKFDSDCICYCKYNNDKSNNNRKFRSAVQKSRAVFRFQKNVITDHQNRSIASCTSNRSKSDRNFRNQSIGPDNSVTKKSLAKTKTLIQREKVRLPFKDCQCSSCSCTLKFNGNILDADGSRLHNKYTFMCMLLMKVFIVCLYLSFIFWSLYIAKILL